jgi:hypothetical protein
MSSIKCCAVVAVHFEPTEHRVLLWLLGFISVMLSTQLAVSELSKKSL